MFKNFLHKGLAETDEKLRHEKKYSINAGVYEIFRGRCAALMQKDEHSTDGGDYRVTSLYLEDVHRNAYKDKKNGYSSRKKYRIRVYNLSPERITLEVKYKEGEHVCKKSGQLTLEEYGKILGGDYSFCLDKGSDVLRDFYAYAARNGLRPAVITDYFRDAYTLNAGNVRVTFDRKVSAGFGSTDVFKASYVPVMNPLENDVVLEIKYDRFIPSYIQELFTGFPLMPEPVSKYVLCADKILEVNKICRL
ncbi:MAG: polyphosphate polymerase domain-containing protein [Oscillospiraceae bacterium]|nr:polyphosphate polymerase domain-containing protein [Oscillospiraceae bacterium]